MPGKASIYDAHAEELMDLQDEVTGCRLVVLKVIADGRIDPAEDGAIEAAFTQLDCKSKAVMRSGDRLAAAARLVRTLFYSGVTPWVRRLARESDRDMAGTGGAA